LALTPCAFLSIDHLFSSATTVDFTAQSFSLQRTSVFVVESARGSHGWQFIWQGVVKTIHQTWWKGFGEVKEGWLPKIWSRLVVSELVARYCTAMKLCISRHNKL
jgi:hypothetical protein